MCIRTKYDLFNPISLLKAIKKMGTLKTIRLFELRILVKNVFLKVN